MPTKFKNILLLSSIMEIHQIYTDGGVEPNTALKAILYSFIAGTLVGGFLGFTIAKKIYGMETNTVSLGSRANQPSIRKEVIYGRVSNKQFVTGKAGSHTLVFDLRSDQEDLPYKTYLFKCRTYNYSKGKTEEVGIGTLDKMVREGDEVSISALELNLNNQQVLIEPRDIITTSK